jgi:hypothetical protein
MVVHAPGVEHADHPAVEEDVEDGGQERRPVLVQRDDAHHHEEGEVGLDVAPGELDDHPRGGHEADARDHRGEAPPGRHHARGERGHRDDATLEGAVPERPPHREAGREEGGRVQPEEDDDAAVPPGPDLRREVASLR